MSLSVLHLLRLYISRQSQSSVDNRLTLLLPLLPLLADPSSFLLHLLLGCVPSPSAYTPACGFLFSFPGFLSHTTLLRRTLRRDKDASTGFAVCLCTDT